MALSKEDRDKKDVVVSVIIPVFNEEATIGDVVARTNKTLEKMSISFEVIVVDNCSEDCSADIARTRKAQVLKEGHKGKGFALRAGFSQARGKFVVTIDGDGSHKPEEIPLVLSYLIDDVADFVVGSRFANSVENETKIPRLNRIGNRLFNGLTGYLTGMKISDTQSGFRAIRASLIKKMELASHGYEVESEMLVKALRMKARVIEIPISFDQRTMGVSKLDPIRDGARILRAIISSYVFKQTVNS